MPSLSHLDVSLCVESIALLTGAVPGMRMPCLAIKPWHWLYFSACKVNLEPSSSMALSLTQVEALGGPVQLVLTHKQGITAAAVLPC